MRRERGSWKWRGNEKGEIRACKRGTNNGKKERKVKGES